MLEVKHMLNVVYLLRKLNVSYVKRLIMIDKYEINNYSCTT